MDLKYKTHYERPNYINNFNELANQYNKLYDIDLEPHIKTKLDNKNVIVNFEDDYEVMNKIFFEALRHYHNLGIVLFFGISMEKCFHKYTKYFNKDYAIYAMKNIYFENLNQKKSFIYQIYSDKINNIQNLEYMMDFYNKYDNVVVLILKSRKFENINFEKYLKTSKTIYYADNITKKMVISGIVFNNTTLKVMKTHNIEYIIGNNENKSFEYIRKYRKWLYLNIDVRDHHLFMLFSSVILYIYGLRECNDLDLYVSDISNAYTYNIANKVNDALILKNGKYEFIDASIQGTSKWKSYWNEWTREWAELYGVDEFKDILINNDHHFYFCGIKMMCLECDVIRRVKRNRPRSMTDLFMLNEKLNMNIRYPSMPKTIDKYFNINQLSDDEIYKLQKKKAELTKDKTQYLLKIFNNPIKYLNTIQWCFKERYNKEYSIEELKNMFNYTSS